MSSKAEKYVSPNLDGGWDLQCPVTDGSCGSDGVGFRSTGWPRKGDAVARMEQHIAEHKGGPATQSLDEFRKARGLYVDNDGKAQIITPEDL